MIKYGVGCGASQVKDTSSGYFDFVEYAGDDFVGGDVLSLSLVGETDTVAEHVVGNGAYIFGHHIAASVDKGVGA